MKKAALFLILCGQANAIMALHITGTNLSAGFIWNDGLTIGNDLVYLSAGKSHELILNNKLYYWPIKDFWLTAIFPVVLENKSHAGIKTSGLGDIQFYGTYMFHNKTENEITTKAAFTTGLSLPTSKWWKNPSVGNSALSPIIGLFTTYQSPNILAYLNSLLEVPTSSHCFKRGYQLSITGAFGYLLPKQKLTSSTCAYLIESTYVKNGRDTCPLFSKPFCSFDCGFGGDIFLIGPTFIWIHGDFFIQATLQVPIFENTSRSPHLIRPRSSCCRFDRPIDKNKPLINLPQRTHKLDYKASFTFEAHF